MQVPNATRTRYESGTADLTKTKAYREYNDTCNKIREGRKAVDKEKQIDYNEIKDYRNYEKSINVGELTPLADFEFYKKIIDTLREPNEITNVEVRASGSTQRFKKYGMAAVSVNPETGNLIQVNLIKARER